MTNEHPSIIFRLDARSDRAPFRQLVDQVVDGVERGQLKEGDQLPSVRDVVRQITINPNTVHRAYRELEHLGIAEGRPGLGTFVKEPTSVSGDTYRANSWSELLHEGVELARSSGISDDQILSSIQILLTSDSQARS
jgi:GntR family transcriptional regulator